MLNKRLVSVLAICGLASLLWACGSDDDDDTSGTGASSSTGGKGTGGKGTGGGATDTGGKTSSGGSATGGASEGGASEGGAAGGPAAGGSDMGGNAGAPVEASGGASQAGAGGAAGSPAGGTGGAAPPEGGSAGTGVAGSAGAGGTAPELTLDEACTLLCGTVEDAECDGASFCACAVMASYLVSEASTAAYEPMVQCLAQVDTTDLICTEDAPNPALDGPIFAAIPAEGVCEDEVCAFECAESQSIYGAFSPTLVARCGCEGGGVGGAGGMPGTAGAAGTMVAGAAGAMVMGTAGAAAGNGGAGGAI